MNALRGFALSQAIAQRPTYVSSHLHNDSTLVLVAQGHLPRILDSRESVAQRRREDDLVDQRSDDGVAALVLLQLDLGLGGLQELHGAANLNHGDAFPLTIGRRMDRLHPAREVATGSRPVMRFDFHRAQRRQLAVEAARAVFW